jgi:succinate dehydrogenase / fumarate reductase, membrane anchor subunit
MAKLGSRSIVTPLKSVRGLGSSGIGTDQFWRQRITAIAQVPLTIVFIVVLLAVVGKPHAAVAATLGRPSVAILMLLFVLAGVVHMKIGMQIIIEDYVHQDLRKAALLALNVFFSFGIGIACAFALLKLSFGA